jgi:hypothetical protein
LPVENNCLGLLLLPILVKTERTRRQALLESIRWAVVIVFVVSTVSALVSFVCKQPPIECRRLSKEQAVPPVLVSGIVMLLCVHLKMCLTTIPD